MLRRAQSCSLAWAVLVWEGGGDHPGTKNKEEEDEEMPWTEVFLLLFPRAVRLPVQGVGALLGQPPLPQKRAGAQEERDVAVGPRAAGFSLTTSCLHVECGCLQPLSTGLGMQVARALGLLVVGPGQKSDKSGGGWVSGAGPGPPVPQPNHPDLG